MQLLSTRKLVKKVLLYKLCCCQYNVSEYNTCYEKNEILVFQDGHEKQVILKQAISCCDVMICNLVVLVF